MEFGQQVASTWNFSLDCLQKSWSSYLTSIPAEGISNPEVAAAAAATLAADLADHVAKVVDFPVVHTKDVAPGTCPSGRISSFRSGRTADGAYPTDPDSGSLA